MAGFALTSYIAPAAPATRRRADGGEAFLRPEVGFTPKWFRERLGIDFGERFHTDPAYRREAVMAMRGELGERFPGTGIGNVERPPDFLTGIFGACTVAGVYGIPVVYAEDNWPAAAQEYLSNDAVMALEPPDLNENPFFIGLMRQVEWIIEKEGRAEGFVNWQGVLNNAYRLRGQARFVDMASQPERAGHLFACVAATMMDAARRLHARQAAAGFRPGFFTVSNCLVNMVSPSMYYDQLLPWDRRIAEHFGCIGIHNCAWNADPYVDAYASVPGLGYVDMGHESDLARARKAFPDARRALMYTPMDLANKPLADLRADFERIAADYAPCDLVLADIEHDTPDERVRAAVDMCREISEAAG